MSHSALFIKERTQYVVYFSLGCSIAFQFSLTQGSSLQLQMIHQKETVHGDFTELYFFDFSHLIQLSSLLAPNVVFCFSSLRIWRWKEEERHRSSLCQALWSLQEIIFASYSFRYFLIWGKSSSKFSECF